MSAAPWTKTPNWIWDSGWMKELPHAELVLILWLVRLSAGYQQEWCEASESELMGATGLSRATLYRSKRALIGRGLLEMEMRGVRCAYRVSSKANLQDSKGLNSETLDSLTGETGLTDETSHRRDGKGLTHETVYSLTGETVPILKKAIKKTSKKTSSSTDTVRTPRPPDDVSFAVAVNQSTQPPDQALITELVLIGVNEPKLSRMLENPELARSCLRALGAQGAVGNKPAWLVTAFERGGYTVPRSNAELAKADREALLQARASARDREAAERAALERAEAAEWADLVAGLSPVALAAVEAEARDSLRPLVGRKLDRVPSDAPQIRAAMRELLRARDRASPPGEPL